MLVDPGRASGWSGQQGPCGVLNKLAVLAHRACRVKRQLAALEHNSAFRLQDELLFRVQSLPERVRAPSG